MTNVEKERETDFDLNVVVFLKSFFTLKSLQNLDGIRSLLELIHFNFDWVNAI